MRRSLMTWAMGTLDYSAAAGGEKKELVRRNEAGLAMIETEW
jgi:hypothetical protein